jgi:hypothetical protein
MPGIRNEVENCLQTDKAYKAYPLSKCVGEWSHSEVVIFFLSNYTQNSDHHIPQRGEQTKGWHLRSQSHVSDRHRHVAL